MNGIHKSYPYDDSYTLQQNEVRMDKPIYLGFAELELSFLERKLYNLIFWILIALC